MGIGDWGLGIGPNPQSPIPKKIFFTEFNFLKINMKKRIKSKKIVKDSC
jgi:hypothetical protein